MFVVQFGVFYIFLLSSINKSQAKGSLKVSNRTVVALAGETVHIHITVTVPANNTKTSVFCSRDEQQVWKYDLNQRAYSVATKQQLQASITMPNSLASGEYFCHYQSERVHWVVLVQDVGYVEPDEALESDVIALLVLTLFFLLFSIVGSVYVFKRLKGRPASEEGGGVVKSRKSKNTSSSAGVVAQGPTCESVYTSLEPRPVSIYDVLNVDQARRESTEKRTPVETDQTCQTEEGIFESVYENL